MNIDVVTTCNELLELQKDWKYIFEKSETNNIFVSWEWCSLWCKHYGGNQKLKVLVVRDGNEIIGIAPLMISKGNYLTLWKPTVSFIGGELADYSDLLILKNNEEVIRTIIDFVASAGGWGTISLKRIPESSPNFTPLKECISELRYPSIIRISSVSPVVKIEGRWDDYYKSISKGLRQDIRTTLNKLKSVGETSFETCRRDTLRPVLDILFEQHRRRQDYKLGQSLFEAQANRNFFYELALTFTDLGWTDISVLKVNSKIISVVFAFKYDKVFYYWIPTFDIEFIKYSLSKVHIRTLLKNCFEQNYKEFDFMWGDEEYKFKWANSTLNSYNMSIYKNNLYCKLDALRSVSREYIKNLYYGYPLFKRMLIKFSKGRLPQTEDTGKPVQKDD